MKKYLISAVLIVSILAQALPTYSQDASEARRKRPNRIRTNAVDANNLDRATDMLEQGKRIFRFDTFGSEKFWGDQIHLHQAIAGAQNGGVGDGLSPNEALALGLKVDVNQLSNKILSDLRSGKVDLDNPNVTLQL